jgi:polysaccharide deacetylase family protein (PEP-CTERM system associated)
MSTILQRSSRSEARLPADAGVTATRPTFVLTFDFEDWHQLVYRRIGRTDWRVGSGEFRSHVSTLLDLLDELDLTATFFVVGVTAERHPEALLDVVARGHEIGCHGHEHRRVFQQTPAEFRRDVVTCLDAVERICGIRPEGYRAPWFSITHDSLWAPEILRSLGLRYDSSLFDSPRIPHRLTPIPAGPFRLQQGPDGLVEFPTAVLRRGRVVLPLGGGAYWRALPAALLWQGLETLGSRASFAVLYFHPYEFSQDTLRVALPGGASAREHVREGWRQVSKNARRGLIRARLVEAAARFRLVTVQDALQEQHGFDPALLREARSGS